MFLDVYLERLCQSLHQLHVTDDRGVRVAAGQAMELAVNLLLAARDLKRKAFIVGNGGSAATAAHLHNDLAKAVGIRALCLQDPALLTASANDDGYHRCFESQIQRWADPGDLLIAISCSGESENIVRAVSAARERDCRVITFTGFSTANDLRRQGALNFYVPSHEYGHVEVAHAALTHYLTDAACAALAQTNEPTPFQDRKHDTTEADIIARTLEIRAAGARDGRGGIRRRRVSA